MIPKPWLLALGAIALGGIWMGPLPRLAQDSFSAHMAVHMGVVAIAAPAIALGIAGGPLDPVRRWPLLFPPIPLSLVELVIVWAWHSPALHHAARHGGGGLVLEQGAFLVAGLSVWMSSCGGDPVERRNRAGAGVIALLLTSMHMTLLGALLALAPRPLYLHAADSFGLTPLEDQHLGGAIMLLVSGVSYLAGALWVAARALAALRKREAVA